MLDVIEPRVEQLGDRAFLGLDDAAVDLGDENGERALRLALRAPEHFRPVLALAGERVGALEDAQLPVAGALLPHRPLHRRPRMGQLVAMNGSLAARWDTLMGQTRYVRHSLGAIPTSQRSDQHFCLRPRQDSNLRHTV